MRVVSCTTSFGSSVIGKIISHIGHFSACFKVLDWGLVQARNSRNESDVGFNRVERQAEINDNPASRRLNFNASAADLLRAAMDADPHCYFANSEEAQ